MKNRIFAQGLILLALIAPSLWAGAMEAKVESVKGEAWLVSFKGLALNRQPLTSELSIPEKGYVETGKDGLVILSLPGRGSVTVSSDSKLALRSLQGENDSAKSVSLGLLNGAVRSKVTPLKKDEVFSISTPTAVAGVRGTDYAVMYQAPPAGGLGETQVATFEGAVALSAGLPDMSGPENSAPPVMVKANQQSSVSSSGGPSQPKALSREMAKSLQKSMPTAEEAKADKKEKKNSAGSGAQGAGSNSGASSEKKGVEKSSKDEGKKDEGKKNAPKDSAQSKSPDSQNSSPSQSSPAPATEAPQVETPAVEVESPQVEIQSPQVEIDTSAIQTAIQENIQTTIQEAVIEEKRVIAIPPPRPPVNLE